MDLLYLDGTQPVGPCTIHKDEGSGANNLLNIITGQNQGSQRIPDQGARPVTGTTKFPGFDSTIKIDLP